MDPIDAIAPDNLDFGLEPSSGVSQYFDAHGGPALEDQPPALVLENQPSFLDHVTENVNSTFVYGAKPAWGWDYVLSFKIPGALKKAAGMQGKKRGHRLSKRASEQTPFEAAAEREVGPGNCIDGEDLDSKAAEKSNSIALKRVEILARLKSAGFVFSQLLIPTEGVILVRLSLPEERMKAKAMELDMELRLKEEYGGGYLAFTKEREDVFVNYEEGKIRNSYFNPADRTIIILSVLQSKEDWGCDLNIERLLHEQTVLQAFAIHSELEQRKLISSTVWARIWDPTYVPPFSDMKDYLGARVTFYFVFVSFYARRLLVIALLSIPVYTAYRLLTGAMAIAVLRWIFSIGLVLWTTIFLETWKRRNAKIVLDWGLNDYKEDTADDTRAQFVGDIRYGFYCERGFVSLADLVEGTKEPTQSPASMEEGKVGSCGIQNTSDIPKNPYQDPRQARNARLQSFAVTIFFVLLVGSLTFLLLWFRNEVIQFFEGKTGNHGFSNAAPGIMNGILITVFDSVWRSVSLILTRRENHRTNQHFENSLVYKRFSFQFISNYISLFYIAFIRPYLHNTCRPGYIGGQPDCMVELENQLMSLVITKATIGQLTEIGIPFITARLKQWRARSKSQPNPPKGRAATVEKAMTSSGHNQYVEQSKLGAYDSTMEDYGELVLQFGYLALFGLAFPPAAVVALVNNLVEGRTDAFKVLVLSQRVVADDAADIGAWYPILECLNVLAVATNAGLVVFTADSAGVLFGFDTRFGDDVWRRVLYRVVAFFIMEHVLLAVKAAAAFIISDVPSKVRRVAARQSYDVARIFGVGWRDAFRGNSLLQVDERQTHLCEKYANMFEVASEDEDGLRQTG